MLTKGHDFSKVTLVAVVDADNSFFSGDFRALEKGAQQLIQVANRARRPRGSSLHTDKNGRSPRL